MKKNKKIINNKKSINGNKIPFTETELMDAINFDIFNYAEKNDDFKGLVDEI